MRQNIVKRVTELAEHVINTGDTVRTTAAKFGVSKSTVHKDLSERLIKIDKELFNKVRKILDFNLSERHIRGGQATKFKYIKIRKKG